MCHQFIYGWMTRWLIDMLINRLIDVCLIDMYLCMYAVDSARFADVTGFAQVEHVQHQQYYEHQQRFDHQQFIVARPSLPQPCRLTGIPLPQPPVHPLPLMCRESKADKVM